MKRQPILKVDKSESMLASWDSQKNILSPSEVKQNSTDHYWWKCAECKSEWLASPQSRRKAKSSCRQCATKLRDKRRLSKTKTLLEAYPEISKEWDYSKNSKDISEVFPGGLYDAHWKCSRCGHEWQSRVGHRTGSGSGCPICSESIRRTKFNDGLLGKRSSLQDSYPEIAKEWDFDKNFPITPDKVLPKSSKRFWWKCIKGHYWKAQPSNRVVGGTGCPFCNSQTSELEIRFYAEFDKLLGNAIWRAKIEGVEIDVLFPGVKLGIEIDGYPWHEGKEEQDKHKTTLLKNAGFTLLHVRHELLEKLSDEDIVFYKYRPYKEVLNRVVQKLQALGFLEQSTAERYQSSDFINQSRFDEIMSWLPGPIPGTSLAELAPHLIEQWDIEKNLPLTPQLVTSGSTKKVWWRCANGHEWKTSISNRFKGGGCAACSKKRASKEHNLSLDIETLKHWDHSKNSLFPSDITPRSNRLVWWKCVKGHSFNMKVKDFSRKLNCPFCSGRRVDESNSMATCLPDLVKYWDQSKNAGLSSDAITISSGKMISWLCPDCRHSWDQTPNAITRRPLINYCPECRKSSK